MYIAQYTIGNGYRCGCCRYESSEYCKDESREYVLKAIYDGAYDSEDDFSIDDLTFPESDLAFEEDARKAAADGIDHWKKVRALESSIETYRSSAYFFKSLGEVLSRHYNTILGRDGLIEKLNELKTLNSNKFNDVWIDKRTPAVVELSADLRNFIEQLKTGE